jgi:hypothetical protein
MAARAAGDEPSALKQFDALPAIGLETVPLTGRESAAADILGGVLLMSDNLLFSSSPFSPYYADRSHPDLLNRVRQALRLVDAAPKGAPLRAETDLIREELRRFGALGHWPHRELFLPGPLTVADVRSGSLWLGRTDIPLPRIQALDEQVYRLPLSAISIHTNNSNPLELPQPLKVGRSKVGKEYNYAEDYGTWVSSEFENGDPTLRLPAAVLSSEPQAEKDWGRSRWGGFEFLGMAWRWPSRGATPAGRVTERDLVQALRPLPNSGSLVLGHLQWQDGDIVIPVAVTDSAGVAEFQLFRLGSTKPLRLVELNPFRLRAPGGVVDVGAATLWHGQWWVPVRVDKGRRGDCVELWAVKSDQRRRFATALFLAGEAGVGLPIDRPARLEPANPKFVPISGDHAVFGYDQDSLYLVDERRNELRILFHPARAGLQLLDLGSGQILFWTLHARKAYVIDTNGSGI